MKASKKKEKEGFDQTLAKEQGALREQLQVHIQTIGILVSEKSELQTSLSFTQQAARQKGAESEDLAMRLQSTKKRVAELERTLSGISLHQKQAEKLNKELEKERDNLRLESLKNSKSTEELKQQNSELTEKLNALLSENTDMKQQAEELHKKLEMAELTVQMEKEGFDQTLAKEQGALREQLQVHIQTIGILVSEKSELQTSLSFTQQAARQKGAESEDLAMRLQSTKKRVAELERTLSGISLHQKQAEKLNKELEKERDNLRLESLENSKSTEELKQQNSELTEKLNALLSENTDMKQQAEEPHKKLEMAELTVQMEKEGFDQTLAKEQGALREQLQVHIQTIGILVSEKSELQTSLSFTQQAARQKGAESEDLAMRLQSTKKRVAELERTLSGISLHQKQAEKLNKELEKERDNLRLESLKNSKSTEELKQQNSELTEKLNALLSENTDMKQQAEELHKKLEMAELTVQMLSSQVGTPDPQQQVQMVMEERNYLQAQLMQVTGALEHLRAERDHYVNKLKEEEAVWQETTQKFTKEIQTLSQEKENALIRIEALDTRVAELLLASAADTPAMEPAGPAEPSEEFLGLQRECERLAQELRELENKYRAQVQDNSHLSLLNHQQEERLQELEKVLERHSEEDKEKQQILENMQNDKTTISRALTQNKQLKEQIAELQMAFVKLTNEKAELTVLVDGYQHDHGKKLADLQESLGHVIEQLAAKEEEVRQLQAHRDEISAHLQQYMRQEIQKQYMLQLQLTDRLQHEEMQRKVSEDMRLKELEKSRENLELLTKENQELREQAFRIRTEPPKQELQRMEGDAADGDDKTSETSLVIPEDFESREEMVAFLNAAIAKLQGERDETARQSKLNNYCYDLLLQVSNLQQQQMTGASRDVTLENVPKEVYDALQSDMDKLAIRFTDLMQEKVELTDRVEELEHRCVQLSGETDTIGEYIAIYQSQRAILKQRHQEKEDYVSRLAQEKEEMKAKLLELEVLVTRLVTERNEWHGKYVDATKTLMEFGEVELPANAETPGIGDADIQGFENVDLENPDKGPPETGSPSPSYQGANPVSGSEDPTAKQIMQLLHEIQNSQKQSSSPLQSTSIPIFYQHDEIKAIVV